MAQNDFDNNNYLNQLNDPLDNIFVEQTLNTTDINKSILDNKNQINSPFNSKSKSPFQDRNIKAYEDEKNTKLKNYYQFSTNQNYNNKKSRQKKSNNNKSIGSTTPNRSFLTKSKLSINSKNNSTYKTINRKNSSNNLSFKSNFNIRNNSPMISYKSNFMRKDPNKESIILNKLTQEVEHIKNYCNELQRQFDNHCMIKNEKKEFDNIKKENIKLTAEVSILKDDVAELMKKFNIINNKIDSMQQENNNLKMQNKNLLNFISIMSNSNNGINKLKSFNMNQLNNNSLLNINNNITNNNQDLFSNNSNNESMNIINLINNNKINSSNNNINNNGSKSFIDMDINNNNIRRNSNIKSNNINSNSNVNSNNINFMTKTNYNFNSNYNNNLNSDQIDFSISKSISKNFDNIQIQDQPKDKYNTTYNNNFDNKTDYTNINTNANTNNTNIIYQSKQYHTIGQIGQVNKNMGNNATDIASLIQSNFNLTNQFRNASNSKNKHNRYLIPKNED